MLISTVMSLLKLKKERIMQKQVTMQMASSGSVSINGRSYHGKNISIVNGDVTVDGVKQGPSLVGEQPIKIEVHGDIVKLETTNGDVTAKNVGQAKTVNGDIQCTEVTGDIVTVNGEVTCRDVAGDVTTEGGDITCTRAAGSVKTTNGDIQLG